MSKVRQVLVMAVMIVVLAANLVGAAEVNSYWQRMEEGFPNSVTIHEYVYEYKAPNLEITAKIPQLVGVGNEKWQAEFNQEIRDQLDEFVARLQEMVAEVDDPASFPFFPYEGIMDFEIKLNRGGLLSLAIVNYSYTGGAHGMTYYDYLNVDLTSGHRITLTDLLSSDAELRRAAEVIDARIKEDPQQFFIDGFAVSDFQERQGFYLQDTQAVICFGLYELAPYAHGIQEFAIPAP